MTYLTLVNNVLARLRESSVASVSTTSLSQLVGKFVNDAKVQVENAWNWDALSQTITVTTSAGVTTYTVTGSGLRHKQVILNNTTQQSAVHNVPIQWIIDQQQRTSGVTGPVTYYAWNGNDGTDSKIEVWPTPQGVETLKVNLYVSQLPLSADGDILLVPSEAVEMGAYARALVERGEDGGLSSSEAFGLYKGILADQIAIESSRFIENDCFVAV